MAAAHNTAVELRKPQAAIPQPQLPVGPQTNTIYNPNTGANITYNVPYASNILFGAIQRAEPSVSAPKETYQKAQQWLYASALLRPPVTAPMANAQISASDFVYAQTIAVQKQQQQQEAQRQREAKQKQGEDGLWYVFAIATSGASMNSIAQNYRQQIAPSMVNPNSIVPIQDQMNYFITYGTQHPLANTSVVDDFNNSIWQGLGTGSSAGAGNASTAPQKVIGPYPEYINKSEALGVKPFSVPPEIWAKMTPAEQWTANRTFLDRAIARGSEFVLAVPYNAVQPGSYTQMEINYLMSQGYYYNASSSKFIK
jgi:hypothetical protein